MLSIRRKRGRPPRPNDNPIPFKPMRTLTFLGWLKEKGILTEEEDEVIQNFHSLYQKVMLAYGVKILGSSLISRIDMLKSSPSCWHLSNTNEKRWNAITKIFKSTDPGAVRALKLLGQDHYSRRDILVISQHFKNTKQLIQDLSPYLNNRSC